jgi:hypothetical protein
MCDGFGIIVTKDGRFLWIEPDKEGDVSHSEIISRAGLTEDHNPLESRKFVRIEFPDWTEGSFRFDENSSLPAWLDEDETKEKCIKVLLRVQPIWAEYDKVVDPAQAEMIPKISKMTGYCSK